MELPGLTQTRLDDASFGKSWISPSGAQVTKGPESQEAFMLRGVVPQFGALLGGAIEDVTVLARCVQIH